jgi:hypothetical protein
VQCRLTLLSTAIQVLNSAIAGGVRAVPSVYAWAGVAATGSITKGAFPTSRFCNKLANKLTLVCYTLLTDKHDKNVGHLLARRLCKQVCQEVCCKNVMVETHFKWSASLVKQNHQSTIKSDVIIAKLARFVQSALHPFLCSISMAVKRLEEVVLIENYLLSNRSAAEAGEEEEEEERGGWKRKGNFSGQRAGTSDIT